MTNSDLPPGTVDYDTFMASDLQGRLRTFNAVSAENRAILVSTHIRRWRDANKTRLSPEQLGLIAEWLEFVTPAAYRSDRPAEVLTYAKDLETRSAAHFSRDEMAQALTIHGSHIPPVGGLDRANM
jgi:hypothetical protein